MNIPGLGYGPLTQYLDFNNQILTVYIPKIQNCQKYKIPIAINLNEIFEKAVDPNSGFLTYEGVKSLDFVEGETFHTFKVSKA